jgi:XRE family transcriptional regulator, regulator of sulfur utilization
VFSCRELAVCLRDRGFSLEPSSAAGQGVEARIGLEIRRLREAAGISVRAFADRVGFSASFISQLENGQVSPSIASLAKISAGLSTTLPELFARSSDNESAVVRAKARPTFRSSWSRAEISTLTPRYGALESLMVSLEPGGMSGKHPSMSEHDQFALVFSGTVQLTLDQELLTLSRGDSVQIVARVPHVWHNTSRRPAQVVLVSMRRPR